MPACGTVARSARVLGLVLAAQSAYGLAMGAARAPRVVMTAGGQRPRAPRVTMTAGGQRPRAVVFDLDGCLWYPDMYMLWGGGAPFSVRSDGDLDDSYGKRVYLLGAVRQLLYALKVEPEWEATTVAVASCTDEPDWAQECMRKFEVGPVGSGVFIKDCIALEQIRKGNKQRHLSALAESSGVPLEEMLFFDNEMGNCVDVAALGVTVAYVPDGVTASAWRHALRSFPAPGEILRDDGSGEGDDGADGVATFGMA